MWGIGILSVITPIVNNYEILNGLFFNIISIIYLVFVLFYFIVNIYTEVYLYPATARKRRKALFDNSFDSKYLEKPTVGYFDNEELSYGSYKLLINCAENCYFTKNIAEKMTKAVVGKNVLVFLVFIGCAYVGFKNNLIAMPITQIILSSLFFVELCYHIWFVGKLRYLFEG